jgi:putative Holliday junction resolvase
MTPRAPGRLLAFDYGLRQIGVAVGNSELGTTQPLTVLRARDGQPDWREVEALLEEWQPQRLIVGDPLNMDGSVSELAQRARRFARRLEGRFRIAAELVDERLSSFAVKQEQREAGHRGDYRARPVDSLAAELILRDYLGGRSTSIRPTRGVRSARVPTPRKKRPLRGSRCSCRSPGPPRCRRAGGACRTS